MDWKRETINDLREKRYLEEYINNYPALVAELEAQLTSVRGAMRDTEPVSGGGGTRIEDAWIDAMARKERLAWNYGSRVRKLHRIERCMALLVDDERMVLELFYVDRPHNYIDVLMRRLHVERSQVYRLKDDALRKLTIAMYGACED